MSVKSRVVPGILVGGLAIAGAGSVMAAAGGSSSNASSSHQQYCPPSSPQAGQPQGGPGTNCGRGTPGGPPEKPPPKKPPKKPKGAQVTVHQHPSHGCARHSFRATIALANVQRGSRARVYRDGHLVATSSRRSFTVSIDLRRVRRGTHVVTLRVRGADGRWVTRRLRFRRC